jgi:hypothetical protein
MIGQILPNNNERCYNNFSPTFREMNAPITPLLHRFFPATLVLRPDECDVMLTHGPCHGRARPIDLRPMQCSEAKSWRSQALQAHGVWWS